MKNYKVMIAIMTLFYGFQVGAMEMNPVVHHSALNSKQKREFRAAIMGMRNTVPKIQNFSRLLSDEQGRIIDQYNEQQAIVAQYMDQYPNDPFIEEKMANHAKFLRKLEKAHSASQKLSQSQKLSESEMQLMPPECCICLEEEPTVAIPCENTHPDEICQSCLNDIMKKDMKCPICRADLKE